MSASSSSNNMPPLPSNNTSHQKIYNHLLSQTHPSLPSSNLTPLPTSPKILHDLHSSIYSTTFRHAFELGRRSAPQASYNLHLSTLSTLQSQVQYYKTNWGQLAASGNLTKAFEHLESLLNNHSKYTAQAAMTPMDIKEACDIGINKSQMAKRMRKFAGVSDVYSSQVVGQENQVGCTWEEGEKVEEDEEEEVEEDEEEEVEEDEEEEVEEDEEEEKKIYQTAMKNLTSSRMHVMDKKGNLIDLGVPNERGEPTMGFVPSSTGSKKVTSLAGEKGTFGKFGPSLAGNFTAGTGTVPGPAGEVLADFTNRTRGAGAANASAGQWMMYHHHMLPGQSWNQSQNQNE
ncbi:hypothetical protein QBC38DRAFT_445733 [Podospora fimiseda]|uniref:Uncharacterized protein n=1 Tax=Podospora fimiseda TaxID=252190 RepID=A0AAN7BKY7_9PEZI|nr:hypothetical protein QBC38DRAFT_445733 [Podospora fimiseda]